jgi:hypothetical protein
MAASSMSAAPVIKADLPFIRLMTIITNAKTSPAMLSPNPKSEGFCRIPIARPSTSFGRPNNVWNTKCNTKRMETQKKCAHPSCRCNAKEDSDYCGTYCEGEAKTSDILCNCGHGDCRDQAAK